MINCPHGTGFESSINVVFEEEQPELPNFSGLITDHIFDGRVDLNVPIDFEPSNRFPECLISSNSSTNSNRLLFLDSKWFSRSRPVRRCRFGKL